MSAQFARAPHIEGAGSQAHPTQAPNAALLIDFDNVTMGMRSDLSKELKTLLGSDIIKGKVTVQRAYADWRRYPQYVQPLSEASIDLIYAPAYGSNKKNATDIRMAIDGVELVFTRPEIGTYILLTGDSDFSSLVLKLKEYGKYVIGVGMQESSSDILVQNCDEYYSYTSLSGLRKSDTGGTAPSDPWDLAREAVSKMSKRGDVMRSDRLKQVMLELDSDFDERSLGFGKFSRFVSEAAQRGILQTRRMGNGQQEIVPTGGGATDRPEASGGSSERSGGTPERTGARGRPSRGGRGARDSTARPASRPSEELATKPGPTTGDLPSAYDLLRKAISDLLEDHDSDAVRDSDVKRRILAIDQSFDESNVGFPKFSRFLMQADSDGVVELRKLETGNYEVALRSGPSPTVRSSDLSSDRSSGASDELPPEKLRLPTDPESTVKYLTNSYSGVGEKTAETLVDALGEDLFRVLQSNPERVREILPAVRADKVLEGWQADYERRRSRHAAEMGSGSETATRSADGGAPERAEPAVRSEPAVRTETPSDSTVEATRLRRGRRTRGALLSED